MVLSLWITKNSITRMRPPNISLLPKTIYGTNAVDGTESLWLLLMQLFIGVLSYRRAVLPSVIRLDRRA